jgi:hypothetical protein
MMDSLCQDGDHIGRQIIKRNKVKKITEYYYEEVEPEDIAKILINERILKKDRLAHKDQFKL